MNWDQYFYNICEAVATKSSCLSRKIGAILVRDKSVVATGFNGSPRGIPHCDTIERREAIFDHLPVSEYGELRDRLLADLDVCPRKVLGFSSGEGLIFCNASHSERNCIINAARLGISTLGTTLYLNTLLPCKDCMLEIINAGIVEIVAKEIVMYNDIQFLLDHSGIHVRTFALNSCVRASEIDEAAQRPQIGSSVCLLQER